MYFYIQNVSREVSQNLKCHYGSNFNLKILYLHMPDYQPLRHYEILNVLRSPATLSDSEWILESADCKGRSEEIINTETNSTLRSTEL
jgi:hypothetical protein